MHYIVLAAGRGTRLHPYTKNYPKCMLYMKDKETVAQRMVRLIKKYDSSAKITYVLGFKHSKVENSLAGCEVAINPFYSVTNSIASLWFVKELLDDEVTIINGDIVVSESLMDKIVKLKVKGATVLLDSSIKKDGDYNVQINGDRVVIMSKELSNYYGEYVGITKFDKQSAVLLKEEICKLIDDGSFDQWYENALVQMVLNSNFELSYFDVVDEEWHEIDTVDDMLVARELCNKEK